MNFVQPIRDIDLIKNIANYLKKENERNYLLFLFGIYTGRRISDILKLKVRELKNKNEITIRETKTGKRITLQLNPVLKKALKPYLKDRNLNEYVFQSRQGNNKPIDRTTAYKILNAAADEFGIENIGTHTLRKTFGFLFYKQTGDIETLMQILNHSNKSVTLRYIGINQETMNEAMKKLKIL